jgi:uncharacterized membrane protein (UPF0127 family)
MARLLIILFFTFAAQARDLDKIYDKARFRLGKTEFTAYIADDDQKRAQGLMFVEKMKDDVGMLFIFEEERVQGFWMKNTLIPLNIGFFDEKGKLVDAQEMKVAESLVSKEIPSYQSASPALFALEMNTKWFEKHKIKIGTRLELVSKTKSKLLSEKLPARR